MRTVTVSITDACVMIRPWVPELESQLTIKRRVTLEKPIMMPSGYMRIDLEHVIQEEKLFTVSGDDGYVYPGLRDRVILNLNKLGIAFTVVDLSTKIPALDLSLLSKELRPGQPQILEVMARERQATIKAATGLGKTETIVQFARVCGRQKLAVVTFKGDVRDSIYDRIREGCPEKTVCILRAGSVFYEADIYVLADKSLHRLPESAIDIVIIDEVHGAGASKAFESLCALTSKRMYGFSATPRGRGDKSDLAIECLCGPVRVDLSYTFSVATGANVPLFVYFYDSQGPTGLEKKSDFVKEKVGIWCNGKRNNLIAHLCRQLPEPEQTMIVCRTLEHVLRLRQLLPSYTCVFRDPDSNREEVLLNSGLLVPGWKHHPLYIVDADTARLAFEQGTLKKVICTPVWREGMDFVHLRWLVRADGTANEIAAIQIGGRLARKTEGKVGAGLIDFWDSFSGFEKRSMARLARYKREGWTVQRIQG
jgi:superfamily II DNA or RNA helicase